MMNPLVPLNGISGDGSRDLPVEPPLQRQDSALTAALKANMPMVPAINSSTYSSARLGSLTTPLGGLGLQSSATSFLDQQREHQQQAVLAAHMTLIRAAQQQGQTSNRQQTAAYRLMLQQALAAQAQVEAAMKLGPLTPASNNVTPSKWLEQNLATTLPNLHRTQAMLQTLHKLPSTSTQVTSGASLKSSYPFMFPSSHPELELASKRLSLPHSGLDLLAAATKQKQGVPSSSVDKITTTSDGAVFVNLHGNVISNKSTINPEIPMFPTAPEKRLYVDEVLPTDILCGRGGKTNHHEGNKRYRQVISKVKASYKKIDEKAAKTNMAHAIVNHVLAYGGRFLKLDENKQKYYILSVTEGRKKTSQALRESKEVKWIH